MWWSVDAQSTAGRLRSSTSLTGGWLLGTACPKKDEENGDVVGNDEWEVKEHSTDLSAVPRLCRIEDESAYLGRVREEATYSGDKEEDGDVNGARTEAHVQRLLAEGGCEKRRENNCRRRVLAKKLVAGGTKFEKDEDRCDSTQGDVCWDTQKQTLVRKGSGISSFEEVAHLLLLSVSRH